MSGFFRILELEGSPYDIGLAHGSILAAEIRKNLELYYEMLKGLAGMEPKQCLAHADNFLEIINSDAASLFIEMEGIANGAGVSLQEIMFLNARSELMSMGKAAPRAGECTAMGLTGARTIDGDPILAQNWDWHYCLLQTTAVFKIQPDEGPNTIFLAEAGQVGKIGMNEHGVGVLLNFLMVEEVCYGLPIHVLLRMVLGTQDVAEATAVVQHARRAGASHFLIGDKTGHFAGLELTPSSVAEIKPVNGCFLHTNHFCNPALAEKDAGRSLMTSTISRFDRAMELIAGRTKWGIQSLTEILSDHDGRPSSICSHVNEADPDFFRTMTVASCIFDLAGKKLFISSGQPCSAAYEEFSF